MEDLRKNKMTEIEVVEGEYSWKSMSLMDFLEEGNVPSSWNEFFSRSDVRSELRKISKELSKEKRDIKPSIEHVFRAFYMTPLEKINIAVIGQNPYVNGSAVGLSFSVKKGNTINPSLKNIYAELRKEGYNPVEDGNLFHWAKQGCFMLNSALTVLEGDSSSCINLWNNFYEILIEYINEKTEKICWLLMGKPAQSIKSKISSKHKVIVSSHPSPFSFKTSSRDSPAFSGSNIFKIANQTLKSWGKEEIKW